MFPSLLTLLLLCASVANPLESRGEIQGIVVNGTQGNEPLGNVDVILRAGTDTSLTPVAETRTDIYGKFIFEDLPLDSSATYLPGAVRDGVHYPGDRTRLGLNNRFVQSRIVAFEAVELPSPLIAEKHEIDINIRHNLLEVREVLLVTNPSRKTYVGEQLEDKSRVTLRLSIPPTFERVTFDSEFYGRRFRIVDHKPVTDIPWPPGYRELKFTYQIPLEESAGVLRRTMDLPCSDVRIQVRGENTKQVSCNLSRSREASDYVEFDASEKLSACSIIELQFGKLPVRWMFYARWGCLSALGMLMLGTVAIHYHRRSANTCCRVVPVSNSESRTTKVAGSP